MIDDYRFRLASNKVPKLDCPYCGAKKHWQRYFDMETGEILPKRYGLCDNANKCGKGLNPYSDGYYKLKDQQNRNQRVGVYKHPGPLRQLPQTRKFDPVLIPNKVLEQTLQGYERNIFLQNLLHRIAFPFEAGDIEKVISMYYLGTVTKGYRAGAITFPYIDINRRIRTIQVKQFNEANHTVNTDFLHSIIEKHHIGRGDPLPDWLEPYKKQDKFVSCLFGEHLLQKYPLAPIALVEAPKTAIYCTLYFGFPEYPENFIWLAVYNKSSFSLDKIRVLQGRDVYVFPDLSKDGSTFKEWQQKAKYFEEQLPGTNFVFYDLMEQLAPNELKESGADLADILVKMDWRNFRKQTIKKKPIPESSNCEKCEKSEPFKNILKLPNNAATENETANAKSNLNEDFGYTESGEQSFSIAPANTATPIASGGIQGRYQTFGDVFDLLKARGYKTLPKNLKIGIPGWN